MTSVARRFTLIILLAFAPPVLAAELEGIVLEVHDGDTLTLVNREATYRIRLADIDAPELDQPRGRDARTSLFHLCALKRAVVETVGEDRYGRTVARISCAGVDASAEQVRWGWACVFTRYAAKDSLLFALEAESRAAHRGLRADPEPKAPWGWRRR